MTSSHPSGATRSITPALTPVATVVLLLAVLPAAHASLLAPETEDKLATFLAIFILFIVPVVLIVLFWMVHILPEKIAHKRQHPQFEAIRTLCLLSLVFGGLLWPIAWIWAYTRPVMYKMAYGTDKHPDALKGAGNGGGDGRGLHDRVEKLERRVPAAALGRLRDELASLEATFVDTEGR